MIIDIDLVKYNYTCYIAGGGPSLKGFDWSILDDKFVIAINRSYEVLPYAQILYFTDQDYWDAHKEKMRAHSGTLVRGVLKLGKSDKDITEYYLSGAQGLETTPGSLKHGSNSPYAATNLAVQLGFKKIYLLGIDMKWGKKGDKSTSHWHSGHKRIDGESVFKKMIANWQTMKQPLKELGVEIINVNTPEQTDLKVFPIKSFEEVFKVEIV